MMPKVRKINKVLIANRGEIAVRVIRACRELGISSVAVYSDCDRMATHVQWATEAYPLGPPPAEQSYLQMEKILQVAKRCGADAIHPGYGFLSENADFSDACEAAGVTFIGPRGESMRQLGDKIRARRVAQRLKIPVVPGMDKPLGSFKEAEALADKFGYPVLVKASAGGGGKGMQQAHSPGELEAAYRVAGSEAEHSFRDPTVYLEKYLENPHHIEVQIFGDLSGEVVALGHRECSLQRRHQKIIEESPSPFLAKNTRRQLTQAAIALAEEVGYHNAGTIEFLVDGRQQIYFLEMNARLQVEHPVTELRTGLDLVRMQFQVAAGESLDSILSAGINFSGHAIECRIYAEDPDQNFFPSPGRIQRLRNPAGPGIRVDTAAFAGSEIPIYYDPMVSKLISWGLNRPEALERMQRALREYEIVGIKTNLHFLSAVLSHSDFIEGRYDTGFVEKKLAYVKALPSHELEDNAAIAALIHHENSLLGHQPEAAQGTPRHDPWKMVGRRESFR